MVAAFAFVIFKLSKVAETSLCRFTEESGIEKYMKAQTVSTEHCSLSRKKFLNINYFYL